MGAGRLSDSYCFAGVRGVDGALFTTLDGIVWMNTGAPAPGVWPRAEYAVTPLAPGIAVLGGRSIGIDPAQWYGGVWTSRPELCCVTGFDAPSASYAVCSGNGDCRGPGSSSCVCTGGWTGDFCDGPPSTPSNTPSPGSGGGGGGGGLTTTQTVVAVVLPLAILCVGLGLALVMRGRRYHRVSSIKPSGGGGYVTVSHPYSEI